MGDIGPAVLAIAGGVGAGKTTTAARLAAVLGWPRASYSGILRIDASRRGLPSTRAVLRQLGAERIARGWPAFTAAVLAAASWRPAQPLIVDGLRHAAAACALRQAVAPLPMLTVFLEAPGTGPARARDRDGVPASGQDQEPDPAEADLPAVRAAADLILNTTILDPAATASMVLHQLRSPS